METDRFADSVRAAVGTPVDRVVDVVREDLAYDAFLAGRSVARLRGRAATSDGLVEWSLVEKVTEGPATASPYLYDNGRREYLAYRSGLLGALAPDLAAPTAYGAWEDPDGRLTLWLEDVGEDRFGPMAPGDALLVAARHLGRLAGSGLGRVPDEPWLFDGWIDRHRQPAAIGPAIAALRELSNPRAVERRIGRTIGEAIGLIEAQDAYARSLRSLPVSLCHHDAVAANVFVRRRGERIETVLIDWESVGPGPIGADLASLLFASPRRGDIPTRVALELVDPAHEAYVAGLVDVGRVVGTDEVRAGFDAAVALRWTLVRDVALAVDRGTPVFRGSARDEPPEAALDELVALTSLLFASASRATAASEA